MQGDVLRVLKEPGKNKRKESKPYEHKTERNMSPKCRSRGGLAGLVCQVFKLRHQQLQHPQRPVPPRVLRRLPQRQRLLPAAPPPKQPLPPPPQQHTQLLRRSSRVRQRTTPASTQYTTSSSCGSGVDDDGQCDDGEFKLGTAPVPARNAPHLECLCVQMLSVARLDFALAVPVNLIFCTKLVG